MTETSRTTTALLEDLADSENQRVWALFDSRYRPILVGFSRRLGLDDADAADVAQETLSRFVQEYRQGKYDRSRGRLRTWLLSIARYRVLELRRSRARRREQRGESAVLELPDEQTLTTLWEQQRRQSLLRQAMAELRQQSKTREKTIHAFELLVDQQLPPETVAERLGMTVHDVYLAKSRVADRLRRILQDLDALYDAGG